MTMLMRRNTAVAYEGSMPWISARQTPISDNLKSSRRNTLTLVAFAYAASMIGFLPGISLYGPELKKQLHLTQTNLQQIAGVQNLTGIFGVGFGLVARQLGIRASIIFGGLLAAACQMAQYALALNLLDIPRFIPFVILQVLARCGLMIADASAFAIPVALFPKQRAMVSSLLACFIPGAVTTAAQVSHFLAAGFGVPLAALLFWPFWSLAVSLSVALVLPDNLLSDGERHDGSRLPSTPSTVASERLLNIDSSLGEGRPVDEGHADIVNYMFLVLVVFGSFSVLRSMLPQGEETLHFILQCAVGASFLFPIFFCCFQNAFGCLRGCLANLSRASRPVEAPKQLSCLDMLRSVDAWLWLITVAFVYSGAQVTTSNAGQITHAAGAVGDFHSIFVVAMSTGVTFGGLVSPLLSDALVSRGLPRPLLPFFSSFLMGGGHSLLARAAHIGASDSLLLTGAAFIGLGMGMMTVQTGVVVCELFGKLHLVVNNAFYSGICHGPVPFIFMLIAGAIFDRHSTSQGHECIGPECFEVLHAIMVVGNLAGAASALILSARTAKIYGGSVHSSTSMFHKMVEGG